MISCLPRVNESFNQFFSRSRGGKLSQWIQGIPGFVQTEDQLQFPKKLVLKNEHTWLRLLCREFDVTTAIQRKVPLEYDFTQNYRTDDLLPYPIYDSELTLEEAISELR